MSQSLAGEQKQPFRGDWLPPVFFKEHIKLKNMEFKKLPLFSFNKTVRDLKWK